MSETYHSNPNQVKVATWENMKLIGENVFRVLAFGEDLPWAEASWRKIEKTPLAYHSDEIEFTRVIIRFFAMAELYNIFFDLSDLQDFGRDDQYFWADAADVNLKKLKTAYAQLNDDLEIDIEDEDTDENDSELLLEFLGRAIEQEYPAVVQCIVDGYGNPLKLMESLEHQLHGSEDVLSDDEAEQYLDSGAPFSISSETVRLHNWMENGFPRDPE